MKHQHLAILLAFASVITITTAIAQRGRPAGGPPAFVKALPETFGILAAADANNDNQLDSDEQGILVEAMNDGTLQKPEWVPDAPEGVIVSKEMIAKRLAGLYATLAPFDADDNDELTRRELGAVRGALMSGKITPPFRRGGPQGGRPFGPPQGGNGNGRPEGAPSFTKNLPEVYAILSAADADDDGQLDATEKSELIQAIEDGTLSKPEGLPEPPEGVEITTEQIVSRLAGLYTRISKLDANNNGLLEESEIASMRDKAQRPGRPQRGFRSGRPEEAGRPNASSRSSRFGGRSLGGARPTRPQR